MAGLGASYAADFEFPIYEHWHSNCVNAGFYLMDTAPAEG